MGTLDKVEKLKGRFKEKYIILGTMVELNVWKGQSQCYILLWLDTSETIILFFKGVHVSYSEKIISFLRIRLWHLYVGYFCNNEDHQR